MPDILKPGLKTTEFWLTAFLVLCGKVGQVLALYFPDNHPAVVILGLAGGFAIDLGALFGYSLSRASVKKANSTGSSAPPR